MQDSTLTLTDAPRALAAYGCETSYQRLWGAAIEGRIPVARIGRRLFVQEADLALIADRLSSRNAA